MRRYSPQIFGQPVVEKKPRKRPAGAVPTEAAEQRMVSHYLTLRGLLYCHVPNGEKRDVITGSRLRGMGVKRGVPDLLIFTPPPGKLGIVGVAIELKRRDGSTSGVSLEQRQWLDDLKAMGWLTHVAFGADDAIAYIRSIYG